MEQPPQAAGRPPLFRSGGWEADLAFRQLRFRGHAMPLGSRAFDVLEALVLAKGQVVSKLDLMARVWGDAFVEDNTLQVHIAAIRQAFGADRGMLRTYAGRGYALGGDWQAEAQGLTAPAAAAAALPARPAAARRKLPLPVSDLIGRDAALQTVCDSLSAYRLVTLAGPGGIGKTRLALAAADRLNGQYDGDVRFVDLATLQEPRLVHSAVAAALDLDLGGAGITPQAIAALLGARSVLILMDNCEHVIDATAALADTIMRQCPNATILATSREVMRIEGEHCFYVQPLSVPPNNMRDPSDLDRHSAAVLLRRRVESLRGGASLHPDEWQYVAAICRRLDGIPLALEFAAARIAVLGAATVLARLDERFDLLTSGRRTALPKHQTLRATLDWSYDLLTAMERTLLKALSVFPGGATLESAIPVVGDALGGIPGIAEGIANLVAKSLVVVDETEEESRWRLLETTRVYAARKLAETGQADETYRRHAMHFRDLIAHAPAGRLTPDDLARYARDIDNVRAALNWSFAPGGDPQIGISLTAGFVPVWLQMLLVVECTESIQRALQHLDQSAAPDRDMAARLHINLGFSLLNTAGLAEVTGSVLRTGLELAESLDDVALQSRAIWATWSLHLNAGRYRPARDAALRLLRIAERSGLREDMIVGQRLLGTALHYLGEQPAARRSLEHVLDHQLRDGEDGKALWFLVDQRVTARAMLARVMLMQGHEQQALQEARLAFHEAQQVGDRLSICYALRNALCPVSLTLEDPAEAEPAVTLLAELAGQEGMTFWTGWSNCLLGQLQLLRGDVDAAIPLLRTGIEARSNAGWLMRNPEFMGSLALALVQAGEPEPAMTVLAEAIAICERDAQLWCLPSLRRIQGRFLLRQGRRTDARACLVDARDLAAEQGALFWQRHIEADIVRLDGALPGDAAPERRLS